MNAQMPPRRCASAMHVVDERRLARRLGAEDLDDPPARQPADPEREVERERAGGDRADRDLRLVAHPHHGALAELALDLRERPLKGGVARLGCLLLVGHGHGLTPPVEDGIEKTRDRFGRNTCSYPARLQSRETLALDARGRDDLVSVPFARSLRSDDVRVLRHVLPLLPPFHRREPRRTHRPVIQSSSDPSSPA